MSKTKSILELPTKDSDERAEFDMWEGGSLRVTCSSDWCGDTETGFGASVGVTLSNADAYKLLAFLREELE